MDAGQDDLEDGGKVLLWPPPDSSNGRAFRGLQANDAHIWLLLLQIARCAHDGASRAHGAYKVGDFALGLLPNFRPSALIMRHWVCKVSKLV